jgi:nitronate monooxygenase
VVEGPLAGGHLGFGMDWAQYDLATIVAEIRAYLKTESARHPADPRRRHLHRQRRRALHGAGAAGVQVATRFTVTRECGLPDDIKQEYFKAGEDDIEVNRSRPPATRCA